MANLAFAEISITPSPIVCCESFLQTLRKSRCARQELLLASASGQKCGRSERWNTGNSAIRGLKISALTMGTMTFGGKGNFAKVGNLQLDEVRKLIDIVADAGVNLIDTANVYSGGGSEGREGAWRGGGVNYDVDFIDCRLKRKDARAACNKCRRSWNRRHSSAALNRRG